MSEISLPSLITTELLSPCGVRTFSIRSRRAKWERLMRKKPRGTPHSVQAIYSDNQLVGFFAIKKGKEGNYLDHLWLLPEAIGKGVGRLAFERIIEECIDLNIEDFFVVSDPDAEGFYLRQGAERIGEVESIPQKRMLPRLKYLIEKPK
ncbi:GNAT family N-acetyltransferase [Akkermansiaceae bacterium]|nr:GNAT family N-acetyltransferase [Akkermansiaceae bacterium]